MLEKEQTDFLNKLQMLLYPDDKNIANALSYIETNLRIHKKPEKFKTRINLAMTVVDNCSVYKSIQPEIIICCLIGKELNQMSEDKVIKQYGYNTHGLLSILKEFPEDFNCDKMYDFFIQQDDDIQRLYLANATNSLEVIKVDLEKEGYEIGHPEIENFINLGTTLENEEDHPHLSQKFQKVRDYFIDYFDNRSDTTKRKALLLSKPYLQKRINNN